MANFISPQTDYATFSLSMLIDFFPRNKNETLTLVSTHQYTEGLDFELQIKFQMFKCWGHHVTHPAVPQLLWNVCLCDHQPLCSSTSPYLTFATLVTMQCHWSISVCVVDFEFQSPLTHKMQKTQSTLRREFREEEFTRDQPSVRIPSTLLCTPGETLPGTEKPYLQFKRIPLPFYLLMFGCRGNMLHSDLGALIQSSRYLLEGPS